MLYKNLVHLSYLRERIDKLTNMPFLLPKLFCHSNLSCTLESVRAKIGKLQVHLDMATFLFESTRQEMRKSVALSLKTVLEAGMND